MERISIYATKASDKVYHQFTEPKLSPSPFQFTFGSSVAFLCRARLNIPQRLRCLTAGQRCLSDPGYGATDNWYARQCILNHKNHLFKRWVNFGLAFCWSSFPGDRHIWCYSRVWAPAVCLLQWKLERFFKRNDPHWGSLTSWKQYGRTFTLTESKMERSETRFISWTCLTPSCVCI